MNFQNIRLHIVAAAILLMTFFIPNSMAEETPPGMLNTVGAQFSAGVDWGRKELFIRVSAPVDRGSDVRNRATLITRKENELREFFPTIFPLCLHNLRIDSQQVLQDLMAADSAFSLRIQELAAKVSTEKSQPSENLKSISIEYRIAFNSTINSLFVDFQTAQDLPRLLEWQPAADYTGLVIYADEPLPLYGSDHIGGLVPSLFPKIYDEDARLILDLHNLDPEVARKRGTVSYAAASDHDALSLVGSKPLVVSARALYGVTPTDLMIGRTDANTLLYNEKTRLALRQGRVLVIVSPKILTQETVP